MATSICINFARQPNHLDRSRSSVAAEGLESALRKGDCLDRTCTGFVPVF